MPDNINIADALLFFAFVVPGFIATRVFGLLQPIERQSLKDGLLEAIAFGIANFALMFWAVRPLTNAAFVAGHPIWTYLIVLLVFFLSPVVMALALHWTLQFLAARNMILARQRTAWDHFFIGQDSPCWVVVHLDDGRKIGGYYGKRSYASLYPDSGHIYLEELWELGR